MRTRRSFEGEILLLQEQVSFMGSLVSTQLERAIAALQTLDDEAARQVIADDDQVDLLCYEIEDIAIRLIATQQPMASDLRVIVATLSIVSDLERMGDHAEGIGKIVLMHQGQALLKPLVDIVRMTELARSMLRRALEAFMAHDAELARQVAAEDDEIDRLNVQVYRELLTHMLDDPRTIDRATWLFWVSHNLERVGDRTTNICERVVYLATGQHPALNASAP